MPQDKKILALLEAGRLAAETMATKEVEAALRHEFDNWLRWGRLRDWLPPSFRCPLGFLYKSSDVMGGLPYRPPPCDELQAQRMERIVCALPPKMREAFVMYRLDRARVAGHVVIVQGRKRKAEILGVTMSHYHHLVRLAHRIVLQEWGKPSGHGQRIKKPAEAGKGHLRKGLL